MSGFGKIKSKPVTLTVYSQLANYSGMQNGWFAKVMLDKFNVKLKIIPYSESTNKNRMKSGNLGDICIFGNDSEEYIKAANKNFLLDWNQDNLLSDYGSYIKMNMTKALEKNAGLTKSGKVYGFGHNIASSAKDHDAYLYHPDIRWDLYKQLGYPKVKTLEDWIPVLEKMKEICPKSDTGEETYGVSLFSDWDGDSVMFVKSTAALYGYDEYGIGLYDVNSQTWQGCLDEGSMYLRCLKFYNQLYQKDLLNPESKTQGYDDAASDYGNGAAFFMIFSFLGSSQYNTEEHIKQGKAMYACASEDQNTLCYGLNVYGGNRVITIGANTKYPELCMKIINWLCTPQGRMTDAYGPQGVTWDYNSKKQPYFSELGLECIKDGSTKIQGGYTGNYYDGHNQTNFVTWNINALNPDSDGETYNYTSWETYNLLDKSDVLNDWRNYTGKVTADQYLDSKKYSAAPSIPSSMEHRSDSLDNKWRIVTNIINSYSWKAIYANNNTEFDKIVNKMQQKANQYGYYNDCCAFCKGQAAKRKAAEDKVLAE